MQNLLDPAILFFVFGVLAGLVKSNLQIPPQISRFLALYLLMALGLKGGFALAQSGLTSQVVSSLSCAILMAVIVPALGYQVLKRFVSKYDAIAVAATYGSVSAVSFITAVQYLETQGLACGGHMAAAMALMESPAIIMAVVMANALRKQAETPALVVQGNSAAVLLSGGPQGGGTPLGKILHESFTDGAQLLLLGAMVVGMVSGDAGNAVMKPFTGDLFKGLLAFFLLDMGLMAARSIPEVKGKSPWMLAYAVIGPIVHASLALGLGVMAGLSAGDTSLLMVLSASASYIAVPAVLRYALPEASPSLYFGMSLGITFPLNILVGIPVYVAIAHAVVAP
ncbi:MAG: hypothetical protein JWP96_385 [Polaromonas sp.]|nr:hypothetical protein [Polaromonas sp.]